MTAKSNRRQNEKSGLTLVPSNPQPTRELQCPNRWLLHSRDEATSAFWSRTPV